MTALSTPSVIRGSSGSQVCNAGVVCGRHRVAGCLRKHVVLSDDVHCLLHYLDDPLCCPVLATGPGVLHILIIFAAFFHSAHEAYNAILSQVKLLIVHCSLALRHSVGQCLSSTQTRCKEGQSLSLLKGIHVMRRLGWAWKQCNDPPFTGDTGAQRHR